VTSRSDHPTAIWTSQFAMQTPVICSLVLCNKHEIPITLAYLQMREVKTNLVSDKKGIVIVKVELC
jgi:hypothetical protein